MSDVPRDRERGRSLSDLDARMVQQLLAFARGQQVSTEYSDPKRDASVYVNTGQTNQIYLFQAPSGGVPALSYPGGSPSTTEFTPGAAECIPWSRSDDPTGDTPGTFYAVNDEFQWVYNVSDTAIPPNAWFLAQRDAYGDWIATYTTTSGGTGTAGACCNPVVTYSTLNGEPAVTFDFLVTETANPVTTPTVTFTIEESSSSTTAGEVLIAWSWFTQGTGSTAAYTQSLITTSSGVPYSLVQIYTLSGQSLYTTYDWNSGDNLFGIFTGNSAQTQGEDNLFTIVGGNIEEEAYTYTLYNPTTSATVSSSTTFVPLGAQIIQTIDSATQLIVEGILSSPGSGGPTQETEVYGANAEGSGYASVVIGNGASAAAYNFATVIGYQANATANHGTAIGIGASAADSAVAIGPGAVAGSTNSIVIGNSNTLNSGGIITIGAAMTATNYGAVCIGLACTSAYQGSICLGSSLTANRQREFVIGCDTGNGLGAWTSGHRIRVMTTAADNNIYTAGEVSVTWTDTTASARQGAVSLSAYDFDGGPYPAVTAGSSSGAAALSFYGGTPIVQPTGDPVTALVNLGLLTSPKYGVAPIAVDVDFSTITFNVATTNRHTVTLGGNRTLAVSGATAGQVFLIRLVQDSTGSRTVTWFSTIKWPGGSAPTLTTTPNKTDTFVFLCTGTGTYDGYIAGQDL